jgi:hypothetical protein
MSFRKLKRGEKIIFETDIPLTFYPNDAVCKYIQLEPKDFTPKTGGAGGKQTYCEYPKMTHIGRAPHGSSILIVYNPLLMSLSAKIVECYAGTELFKGFPNLALPLDLAWVCRIYELTSEVL